ncbi:MAG TPA: phosphoribosyl-AMP cyclohydrolase [Anaeromyxobacteraceae bacterium]|nr:phosphoribosyl-AMP cyclohydrolase [Anaeromyxobacteraceae bacterium]
MSPRPARTPARPKRPAPAKKAAPKAKAARTAPKAAPKKARAPRPAPLPRRPPAPRPDPAARSDLEADSVAASSVLDLVKFDERGLVPVVAQEEDGTVLMLAWANRAALDETLATGRGTYWSRSRQELWRKGDTSGHVQQVSKVAVDCDGDAVLYVLRQEGPACHTGAKSCFFTTQEIAWPTSASSPRSGAPSRPAGTTRPPPAATPASSSRRRPRPAAR